jgi:uncharacterized membrane protein HdeD (DUF308 family)
MRCSHRWTLRRVLALVAAVAILIVLLHPLAAALIPLLVVGALLLVLGRVIFRR